MPRTVQGERGSGHDACRHPLPPVSGCAQGWRDLGLDEGAAASCYDRNGSAEPACWGAPAHAFRCAQEAPGSAMRAAGRSARPVRRRDETTLRVCSGHCGALGVSSGVSAWPCLHVIGCVCRKVIAPELGLRYVRSKVLATREGNQRRSCAHQTKGKASRRFLFLWAALGRRPPYGESCKGQ